MKKFILIVSLLVSSISLGAGVPTLNEEITSKLILDLSKVELNENHQDFVVVNFYIHNGEIEIEEITGTQSELIQKVKNKLSQLNIERAYDEETLYRYKFTFNKI